LLLGRARLSLSGTEPGSFEGAVTLTRHSFGLDDVSARLQVGALFAPIAVSTLDFDDVSAGFTGGRCTRGEGRVRAAVAGETGMAGAVALSGLARCAGEALLLPLAGQTGAERLDIRLFADGRYRLEMLVRPADPALRGRLVAAGFRPLGNGYGRRIDGAF
jgi:general secretion pathway protein N